jgi:ABC-2 type transport system ATP-binding protein
VRDLVVRYGPVTAVDGLTLTLPSEGVTALLGPNGAGKTTTVEVCEGLRRPSAGSVRVLGRDPADRDPAQRARVGVMLQSGGVPSAARAVETLRHVARLHRDPVDVDALALRLGLNSIGRTPYRRMSGGERQRLSLAMALVGRPELVFLDEPTAGLDVQGRHATWELVRELAADGVGVVLTTHYLEEAERLADRVAVIDRGRLVAFDTVAALLDDAQAHVGFSARAGAELGPLRTLLGPAFAVEETAPGRYRVSGPDDGRLLATVSTWCADQGLRLQDVQSGHRTLEDLFLDLTARNDA